MHHNGVKIAGNSIEGVIKTGNLFRSDIILRESPMMFLSWKESEIQSNLRPPLKAQVI